MYDLVKRSAFPSPEPSLFSGLAKLAKTGISAATKIASKVKSAGGVKAALKNGVSAVKNVVTKVKDMKGAKTAAKVASVGGTAAGALSSLGGDASKAPAAAKDASAAQKALAGALNQQKVSRDQYLANQSKLGGLTGKAKAKLESFMGLEKSGAVGDQAAVDYWQKQAQVG